METFDYWVTQARGRHEVIVASLISTLRALSTVHFCMLMAPLFKKQVKEKSAVCSGGAFLQEICRPRQTDKIVHSKIRAVGKPVSTAVLNDGVQRSRKRLASATYFQIRIQNPRSKVHRVP